MLRWQAKPLLNFTQLYSSGIGKLFCLNLFIISFKMFIFFSLHHLFCRPTNAEARILKIKSNGFIVFVPKYVPLIFSLLLSFHLVDIKCHYLSWPENTSIHMLYVIIFSVLLCFHLLISSAIIYLNLKTVPCSYIGQ